MDDPTPAATFLFVTWPGGGNTNPLVALGARLRARGHRIVVLASPVMRARYEGAGFEFHAMRTAAEVAPGLSRDHARPLILRATAEDFVDAAARIRPDLAVIDFMMPEALSAAETTEVPVAAFVHTLYSDVAIAESTPMSMSGSVEAFNALRSGLGLDSVTALPALLDRCARVLVATSATLDGGRVKPGANVVFTGPLLEESPSTWQPPFEGSRPLVHVSMGTVAPDSMALPIVQAALDGLAGSEFDVLVTLPRPEDQPWSDSHLAPQLRVPANALVVPFVPHPALLPHTAVFVTHAGLGSVAAALTFGVPMVCTPIFLEQPQNAARVEAIGTGLAMTADASPETLRSAVERVFGDARYREAAKRVAEELTAAGSGQRAVTELEAMVRSRR